LPAVLFIVGPTASGKTPLAVELAKRLNGEVVSADSMLVYRGMDIGTAKPSSRERRGVPHHGIDLLPPSRKFSVFQYRRYALKVLREITGRGHLPIVAGGTGFYVRALLEGLSSQPGANAHLRRKLEREALLKGPEALYAKLLKADPVRAKAIGPHNLRRIIRALEIYRVSGRKPSEPLKKSPGLEELGYRPVVIGLNRDRAALYDAINRRVDTMFRKGLVREVRRLAKQRLSDTARQGVGYKELFPVIAAAGVNAGCRYRASSEVKDRIKQATRHFAKRQWTWFRREKGIRWVDWPEGVPVAEMARRIAKDFFGASHG
jgi:tRNA dimethylallyltransferase